MEFIGRKAELARLREINELARASVGGYLTMITGRRRIGKTTLVKHFLEQNNIPNCYFFVSRKQPKAMLVEFTELLTQQFPEISGLQFANFDGFFKFLFQTLERKNYTFVFDEFQNFLYVDASVFSIVQKYWDEYKDKIKGHIIVIGSLQTVMHTLFEDQKEPLFKRLTGKMILKPFSVAEMNSLFAQQTELNQGEKLKLQLLFNGIPFYYYLMERENLFGKDIIEIIQRLALRNDGLLFNEGKELTIEEFGKNYGRYFSILEAIASGFTQWNDISTHTGILPNSIGKYLDELLNYYDLIERKSSVFSSDEGKSNRYYLKDNFLTFWFRYVHKNFSLLENYSGDAIIPKVKADLPNFFGVQFEKLILDWLQRQCIEKPNQFPFDVVGKYWDRGQNEIDLLAYQEKGDLCLIGECKLSSKRITSAIVNQFQEQSEIISKKRRFKTYRKAVFVGDVSPDDLKISLQGKGIEIFDVTNYFD
ncbi:MAG: ATP-binding protein [candidate division KSB1 bacterium]|nr:ATP-binding protein [candidate division KSB1 bacterium]